MHIEPVHLVGEAFRDATYGVVAKLAGVPRLPGDAAPPTPTILTELDSMEVAHGRFPQDTTCLTVQTYGYDRIESEIPQLVERRFAVTLLIRYQDQEGDSPKARKNAGYTLRACLRTLGEFSKDANASARRINGIGLEYIEHIQPVTIHTKVESSLAIGGMLVTYAAVDINPLT